MKEASMTPNQRRWPHHILAIAAILCSATSLFALVKLGGPRWTTSLNVLALILVFLAMKTRDDLTEADFETFAAVLSGLGSRKVLVHCQVNLRASSMVFLYRTIVLKEEPRVAYQAVSGVWSPEGPWRRLIEAELRKHKVAFDLL
jgi:hypothetical protein